VLLAHARGCQRIDLYTAYSQTADDDLRARFRELVQQRGRGKPVAYLVGHREFFSLDFRVTADVLIPRPETELLVVEMLDLAKSRAAEDSAAGLEIADVGTGSGAIAVTVAKHLPQTNVAAIDVSAAALAIAGENAERHGVAERVELIESDLFAAFSAERCFDFVLSNPPYISRPEYEELSPTVRDFEPRQALLAGEDGLSVIRPLIGQAAGRLRPGGWVLLEISPMLAESVSKLVSQIEDFEPPLIVNDLAGLARVVKAQRR